MGDLINFYTGENITGMSDIEIEEINQPSIHEPNYQDACDAFAMLCEEYRKAYEEITRIGNNLIILEGLLEEIKNEQA
jgi:hypothetical protein